MKNNIKYLALLFIFSCTPKEEIKEDKPEIIEFVVKEKLTVKKPNYYEFYLKSKDTVFEVSSGRFVFFDKLDTLFLEKSERILYLKNYKKYNSK